MVTMNAIVRGRKWTMAEHPAGLCHEQKSHQAIHSNNERDYCWPEVIVFVSVITLQLLIAHEPTMRLSC